MIELYKKYIDKFKELEVIDELIEDKKLDIEEFKEHIKNCEETIKIRQQEKRVILYELEGIQKQIKRGFEND